MEQFKEGWYQFFLKGLIEFSKESIRSGLFFFRRLLIAASIAFCVIDLFR
jgi:urea transporter